MRSLHVNVVPFYIKDFWIPRIWYLGKGWWGKKNGGRSWNQSLTDIKKSFYYQGCREPLTLLVGMKNGAATEEGILGFPQKVKYGIII